MKNVIYMIATWMAIFCTMPVISAQTNKDVSTATIHVDGVCNACKKRIETAAYLPGVKNANWDKATGQLTVTFRPSKTSVEKISTEITKVGHNAGELKAHEDAYNKLPACCSYNNNAIKKH